MMSDSIADMLTRIRNAQMVGKKTVSFPNAKLKRTMLDVLKAEGFVGAYTVSDDARTITLVISYHAGRPVIDHIRRSSRPGLRYYAAAKDIPLVKHGLGISLVSTSKGVLTDHQAREMGVGGEILCEVY